MVVVLVVEVWACIVVVVKKVDVVENVSIITVSVNVLVTVLVEVMLTVRAFGVSETVDRVVDSTTIGNRPSYIIRVFVGAFFTELPDTFVEYFSNVQMFTLAAASVLKHKKAMKFLREYILEAKER